MVAAEGEETTDRERIIPKSMNINDTKTGDVTDKMSSVYLYGPHKVKGCRHYLKDCYVCPDKKRILLKQLADEKTATGPSRSTSGKIYYSKIKEESKVSGRVNAAATRFTSFSFSVTLADKKERLSAHGRAEDGADESIVSACPAEYAIFNGIDKWLKIVPVKLQVALKKEVNA